MAYILAQSLDGPPLVGDGHYLMPVLRLSPYLLLQVLCGLQYLVYRRVQRPHACSLSSYFLFGRKILESLDLVWLASAMFVVLLAHAERAEWYALVQALFPKRRTEEVEGAFVWVLGEDEGDEIERVGSSEFSPSVFGQYEPPYNAFAFTRTPDDYTSPARL